MLQINIETGTVEAASSSGEDNQRWSYIPSSEGGVTLQNVGTTTTYDWIYDIKQKTLMNEDGHFAYSAKKSSSIGVGFHSSCSIGTTNTGR